MVYALQTSFFALNFCLSDDVAPKDPCCVADWLLLVLNFRARIATNQRRCTDFYTTTSSELDQRRVLSEERIDRANRNVCSSCKHKICERKVVHWSPDFIVLRVFNDLETCRPYKLMTNLEIDKFLKKFIERFPNNYHICRCRPNYLQKWQQEHLNARSSNPFFSQSVVAIPIILYTQF